MHKKSFWFILLFSILSVFSIVTSANASNATADSIKAQLDSLRGESADESAIQVKALEETLTFIEKTKKQQAEIESFELKIKEAPAELKQVQDKVKALQDDLAQSQTSHFDKLTSQELEVEQDNIHQQLQVSQAISSELGSSLASYRAAFEQTRRQINENNTRLETLKLKNSNPTDQEQTERNNAEIKYLETVNKYNQLFGQNIDLLTALDEAKRNQAYLKQQLLQKQLSALQDELNALRVKEHEAQAKQNAELKASSKAENTIVFDELSLNTDLSQYLVDQTKKSNKLSQENLRAKSVLDGLTQTRQNIEEQISALQGTLVLSKIINQQKQALPTESIVKSLSTDIAKLRVEIFETSQKRDELYNLSNVIAKLKAERKVDLDDEETKTLESILKEREKILVDLIKTLNTQLTLSNEIEATQKQIITLSDTLQAQLQQQSFWVRSNIPFNLDWVEAFPRLVIQEVAELSKFIGFDNLAKNLASTLGFIFVLLGVYGLILWKKPEIKQRLSAIASQVNTLKNDSHWHTPEAMFWTIILALPSALMFLVLSSLILYFFFPDPLAGWKWITQAFGYWLFFATVISLLRPNGLAFRHFGMPQQSNETFEHIIKQSVWIVVLLLVSSIFSQVDAIGFSNDVIGQVMTIVALSLCLFVVRPWLNKGMLEYEKAKNEDGTKRSIGLFKLARFMLFIVPITLIVLIVLGYYYTAVYLIDLIIKSYVVALVWVFGRYFAYRSLTISSRRMAYRRLQKKREKIREQMLLNGEDVSNINKEKPEEKITIATVNEQIFRMADLVGWVVLFASMYAIWSDLLSIANYLNTFILWEQVETTSKGTVVESVTLLNILRSMTYITVTYVLVKNIKGILEVLVFSRLRLSKGTPHTITAILTYFIVVFGSISAFTSLGISWSKIQWVFTALSVGLGFGVREIFGSFVSGTILLFERPIRVGDKVSVGNFTGVITKIKLRSTTLIDDDHKEVVLPNQAFVTDRFINWTYNNTITRLQIGFKIASGVDLSLVRELLLQASEEAEKVMKDPSPSVNLLHFGDGWIEHELTVCVAEIDDRASTRNFLYKRIDELFNQHNIKIAFNKLDVQISGENRPLVTEVVSDKRVELS
ncbi:potassium transporter KefA [Pasteurellaceae bacterium LFhippo2]|nr:potassium transporter KefA [Pasteurellaceae bacterium LFhippo2]